MIIEKCLVSENCSTTTTTTTTISTTTTTTETGETPTLITTTSPSLKVNSSTVFVEGDVVVEQIQSYDPDTKELTVSVPAHSDREAITVILGETSMITAYNAYCIFGDSPDDLDTSSYETPKPDTSTHLNTSDVQKVFIFNVIEEEMTDDEKESLPESFKTLCESKTIRKTSQVKVNETVYDQSNFFNNTLLNLTESAGLRTNPRDEVNTF